MHLLPHWPRLSSEWKAVICRFCQGCARAREASMPGPGGIPRGGTEFLSFKWLPVIDGERCNACGACVEACVHGCLKMSGRTAALTMANACGSEERCLAMCQDEAIRMRWIPTTGDLSHGRWRMQA